MPNSELYEDVETQQSVTQHYLGLSFNKFLILFSIVIAFGIYLGVLLYGDNSMQVLTNLQEYETYLKTQTYQLKNENAALQRDYFEVREISAQ